LKNIDRYAFALTSIDSITIPDSVETIDDEAFFASGIKHLVVGKGVQSAGFIRSASGAGSLEFHSASVVNYITSSDIIFQSATNVVVGSEICEVPAGFYEHFPALKQSGGNDNNGEIDDPNATVVTVRDGLLVSVQGIGLTSLDIPNTVTQVADTAFSDCSELREIIIPDSVESIEANAFHNCTNLERLVVGSGVMEVGTPLFSWSDDKGLHYGSPSLKELVVNSPLFYESMFIDGNWNWAAEFPAVTNVVFGEAFTSVGNMGAFPALETVALPETLEFVNERAFWGCRSLRELTIPESATFIGQDAFHDCTSLERLVVLCEEPTNIGAPLFSWWDEDAEAYRYGSQSLKELVVNSPQFYESMFMDGNWDWAAEFPAVTNVVFGWRFVELPEDYLARFPNATNAMVEEAMPVVDGASNKEVATILNDATDAGLSNVVDVATYNALRTWAIDNRQYEESQNSAMARIMTSQFAWSAFALDAPELLTRTTPIQKDEIKVASFEKSDDEGLFALEVSINDVTIGSSADGARLAKVFGIEGATSLGENAFSSDNVSVEAAASVDGKVRLVAKPNTSEPSNCFFMRVRVNQ